MSKKKNSGDFEKIPQIIKSISDQENTLKNVMQFDIRNQEHIDSQTLRIQLEDQLKEYIQIIEKRPTLQQGLSYQKQFQENKIQASDKSIETINEGVQQIQVWLADYSILKLGAKFSQYEELVEQYSQLKFNCDEIIEILQKMINFVVWQNNLKLLVQKLENYQVIELDQEQCENRQFVENDEITEILNQNIGIYLENPGILKQTYQIVQNAYDLQEKIEKALEDPNVKFSKFNEIRQQYLSQNILIKDYQALKFRVLHQKDTVAAIKKDATLNQIQEKIVLLSGIDQCAGKDSRDYLLEQLKQKLDTGSKLKQNLDQVLMNFTKVTALNVKELYQIYNEAQGKKIILDNIEKCQNILKMYKWLIKLYCIDQIDLSIQSDNLLIGDQYIQQIEDIIDQCNAKIPNLKINQLEYLKNYGQNCTFIDNKILQLYDKVVEKLWYKSANYLLDKDDIKLQELIEIVENAPQRLKENNNNIYNKIQQIIQKAQNFENSYSNVFNGQLYNKILQFIDNIDQSNNQDGLLQEINYELEHVIGEYSINLSMIKGLNEKVDLLQKYQSQVQLAYECSQLIYSNSFTKQILQEKICSAKRINLPETCNIYKQLVYSLENFDTNQQNVQALMVLDNCQNKSKTLIEVKGILEELEQSQTPNQTEDINHKMKKLKEQVTTCEQWLESVLIFTQNSKLTKEYLEDEQNINFIVKTIQELKSQAQDLPFTVTQGIKALNSYEQYLKAMLFLTKGKGIYKLEQWKELLQKTKENDVDIQIVNEIESEINKVQGYQQLIDQIKQNDSLDPNDSNKYKNCILIEELKKLASDIFNSRIKLENETKFIKELLARIQKNLEKLDNLMKQTPKPNIQEVQKMLDKLKKLPVSVKEYSKAIENKIQKAQDLAKKLSKTYDVNNKTAEKLLDEYHDCNIFIADGHKLEQAYHESQVILQDILTEFEENNENYPINYNNLLKISEELAKVKFDIAGKFKDLLLSVYTLRIIFLKSTNFNQLKTAIDDNKLSQLQDIVPKFKDQIIYYRVPEQVIILSFQAFKQLMKQGYALKIYFNQNVQVKYMVEFMECIANKIEDYILDIYKIKEINELQTVSNSFVLSFIDCSVLIDNHKKSLIEYQWGYQPVLESLILKEEEEQKSLVDTILTPIYILNQKGNQSPISNKVDNTKTLKQSTKKDGQIQQDQNQNMQQKSEKLEAPKSKQQSKHKMYEPNIYQQPPQKKKKNSEKIDKNQKKLPQFLGKRGFLLDDDGIQDSARKKVKVENKSKNKQLKAPPDKKQTIGQLISNKDKKVPQKEKLKEKDKKQLGIDELGNRTNKIQQNIQIEDSDITKKSLEKFKKSKENNQELKNQKYKQEILEELQSTITPKKYEKYKNSEEEIALKKKYWQEMQELKTKNETISSVLRSENIAKIRTYLERCVYLKLTSPDALNIAKRLEQSCYFENQNKKKWYDKATQGIINALKKIRKWKYLNLYFMETGYKISYLQIFSDMELEQVRKENERTREEMIQKRLKSRSDNNKNLLLKRLLNENSKEINQQTHKKIKTTAFQEQLAHVIKKAKSPSKSSFKSTSIPKSTSQHYEDDYLRQQVIRKQKLKSLEEITPEKKKIPKKQYQSDIEELLLTQNFEPINFSIHKFKKFQKKNSKQHETQQKHKYQPEYHQVQSRLPVISENTQPQILKIYEGMMQFSSRSCTKIYLLTACNYYDVIKIPELNKYESKPLIPESSMSIQNFSQYFNSIIRDKKQELIIGGWIKATLDLYQGLCQATAEEFLKCNIVGLSKYTDYSSVYFLHQEQINEEWYKFIDLNIKANDNCNISNFCFVIISTDLLHSIQYPKIQPTPFDIKLIKQDQNKTRSRSYSRERNDQQKNREYNKNQSTPKYYQSYSPKNKNINYPQQIQQKEQRYSIENEQKSDYYNIPSPEQQLKIDQQEGEYQYSRRQHSNQDQHQIYNNYYQKQQEYNDAYNSGVITQDYQQSHQSIGPPLPPQPQPPPPPNQYDFEKDFHYSQQQKMREQYDYQPKYTAPEPQWDHGFQEQSINTIQDMKNAYRKKASVSKPVCSDNQNLQQVQSQPHQFKKPYFKENINSYDDIYDGFNKQQSKPLGKTYEFSSYNPQVQQQKEQYSKYNNKNNHFNKKTIDLTKPVSTFQPQQDFLFKDQINSNSRQIQEPTKGSYPYDIKGRQTQTTQRDPHITILNFNQTNNLHDQNGKSKQQLHQSQLYKQSKEINNMQDKRSNVNNGIQLTSFEKMIKDKYSPLQKIPEKAQKYYNKNLNNRQVPLNQYDNQLEFEGYPRRETYQRGYQQLNRYTPIKQQEQIYNNDYNYQHRDTIQIPEYNIYYPPVIEQMPREYITDIPRDSYSKRLYRGYETDIGDYSRNIYSRSHTPERYYPFENPDYRYTPSHYPPRLSFFMNKVSSLCNDQFGRNRKSPYTRNFNNQPVLDYDLNYIR